MPNWVHNRLIIHGDAEPVLAAVKGTDTLFDFDRVVPMPPKLDVESGTKADVALLCAEGNGLGGFAEYQWVREAGITTLQELCQHYGFPYDEMVALGKQLLDNINRFGHKDWYGWCCDNWGTKWNACEPELMELEGRTGISFDTAWDPPIKIVEALAKQFPTVEFSLTWTEPENQQAGVFRVRNERSVFKEIAMDMFTEDGKLFDPNTALQKAVMVWIAPHEDLSPLGLTWRGPCECSECKNADVEQHSLGD